MTRQAALALIAALGELRQAALAIEDPPLLPISLRALRRLERIGGILPSTAALHRRRRRRKR